MLRIVAVAVLAALAGLAANKPMPMVRGENSEFVIEATLYKDHEDVKRLLGQDIDKGIVAVAVRLTPKKTTDYEIWRDDFILRSDKDGEKSEPYDPGQIAGNTVIKVVYTDEGGGNVRQEDRGPVWGGMGGRMPGRLPGSGGGIGNTQGVEAPGKAQITNDPEEQHNPLLRTLRERLLPEEKLAEPVAGLLYFPLEGKHKTKQIWLHYIGKGGKINLRFHKSK